MEVFRPSKATVNDLRKYHSDDYVTFLQRINVKNITNEIKGLMRRFDIGTHSRYDCPIFDGMFELSQISAGGSLNSAVKINRGEADICINWAGGLHHAKKSEASGFCYVNDIVLCILELLKSQRRVLYVDIDCHHGDGVEEAFYATNRVMTVSFHQFGDDFFPGSGGVHDNGAEKGRHYSVNVPFKAGMNDEDYEKVFVPIMMKVMQVFDPSVVVLQCGADSLAGDKLGNLNLTLKGHGRCVEFIRRFNLPLILLGEKMFHKSIFYIHNDHNFTGGGGYTVRNVSRCWAYETSIALNYDLSNDLPACDYYNYFKDVDYKLHVLPEKSVVNENTPKELRGIISDVFENLRNLEPVPSVQIQKIPHPFFSGDETDVSEANDDIIVSFV